MRGLCDPQGSARLIKPVPSWQGTKRWLGAINKEQQQRGSWPRKTTSIVESEGERLGAIRSPNAVVVSRIAVCFFSATL